MNKTLNLFCISFMLLILLGTNFALAAQDTAYTGTSANKPLKPTSVVAIGANKPLIVEVEAETEAGDEETVISIMPIYIDEPEVERVVDVNVKRPLVNVINTWNGFVVSEDETKAEPIRAIIVRKKFANVLAAVDVDTIEEIKELRATETADIAKIKAKELLRKKVANIRPERGIIGGLLIVGKGKNHESYRMIAREITEDSAVFTIYRMGSLKVIKKSPSLAFRVRKALRLASEEDEAAETITEEIDTAKIEPIGYVKLERFLYPNMEIDYGKLVLEEGKHEGTWDLTAYAIRRLPLYKLTEPEAVASTTGGAGQGSTNA